MNSIDNLVRVNIRTLVPYSSARDEFKGRNGVFLDANENPWGPVNRYPDPYHRQLKEEVSSYKRVDKENIFFGNGSDEIIDLLFRIFCNPGSDHALTFSPTYGMYEVTAAVNDVEMRKIPLNEKFDIDYDTTRKYLPDEKLKLIFICSPNNPTGNCFSRETIIKIIKSFRGIVVIDEAYSDFSPQGSLLPLIKQHKNLVIMQTFSKAWGAAGIRVGMAFACSEIIAYLYRIKPPYNISSLNLKAAIRKMKDTGRFSNQVETLISERERVSAELSQIPITEEVYRSDSNFLLVRVKDAGEVYRWLTERSIIVRNRSSVVNNCLRITIGKRSENNMLLNALKKVKL